jgi:hypothetical protein
LATNLIHLKFVYNDSKEFYIDFGGLMIVDNKLYMVYNMLKFENHVGIPFIQLSLKGEFIFIKVTTGYTNYT